MSDSRPHSPREAPAIAGHGTRGDAIDALEILSAVDEVLYEWTIDDDVIHWGGNLEDVLDIPVEAIASGRNFAALLDSANLTSRNDVVLNSTAGDTGKGVPYEVQYVLRPKGRENERRIIVEDCGRWYADSNGRPERARGVIRVINERHERDQRLAFLSRYDELTGYFNRQHLLATLGEALNNARQSHTSIAFFMVAVDSFRAINEAYGFETADQVFVAAAKRIKSQLRDGDAIGRYSGNKLGLILMNCDDGDMQAAAERFHAAIRNGVVTAGSSSVAVSVSIGGVALPRHGRTVADALARAQESLHRARAGGNGRFTAYAPSTRLDLQRRANADLSSEMVAALDKNRLRLFFQPVVDIDSRAVTFHESLVRLERANGTFTEASNFIELCESLGLIRPVDHYTLARAIEALEANPTARLSLNVSGETVGDSEWLSQLAKSLTQRRDLAGRLIVEITETAVIKNIEEAAHFIDTIHDLGCLVAIDDFGAGYSSFKHLRTLAVDIVKIAGEFVQNLPKSGDDQAFVKALTELAHNFGIAIVAEWVQDEESVALLSAFGVDMIQGKLSGLPSPEWTLAKPPGSA